MILKINFVLLLKKMDLVLILLNNKINKKTKLMINSIVFKIAMYRVEIFCRTYMCVISVGCFFLIFVTQYYTMFHEVMEFLLKKTSFHEHRSLSYANDIGINRPVYPIP